jgi:hypothetical protein
VHAEPSIKRLIRECWVHEPASRPSFEGVMERLEALEAAASY